MYVNLTLLLTTGLKINLGKRIAVLYQTGYGIDDCAPHEIFA